MGDNDRVAIPLHEYGGRRKRLFMPEAGEAMNVMAIEKDGSIEIVLSEIGP